MCILVKIVVNEGNEVAGMEEKNCFYSNYQKFRKFSHSKTK